MTIDELVKKTGRSKVTIYKIAKRLREKGINRLPTTDEILNRKNGRPRKYNY